MNRLPLVFTKMAAAVALAACVAPAALAQASAPANAPAQAATADAGDAALAAKLKGQWVGNWEIGNFGGKFVLVITDVEGNNLKGEGQWYGTATGDVKEPLKTATVQNGVLVASHPGGTNFKLKPKGDNELAGTWELTGYTGPLTAKRQ